MGGYPVIEQQDLSGDFCVSPFVGLEQRRAAQIGEQDNDAKKTNRYDEIFGWLEAFWACDLAIASMFNHRRMHRSTRELVTRQQDVNITAISVPPISFPADGQGNCSAGADRRLVRRANLLIVRMLALRLLALHAERVHGERRLNRHAGLLAAPVAPVSHKFLHEQDWLSAEEARSKHAGFRAGAKRTQNLPCLWQANSETLREAFGKITVLKG
jgi:hypothetical protein